MLNYLLYLVRYMVSFIVFCIYTFICFWIYLAWMYFGDEVLDFFLLLASFICFCLAWFFPSFSTFFYLLAACFLVVWIMYFFFFKGKDKEN